MEKLKLDKLLKNKDEVIYNNKNLKLRKYNRKI